MSLKDQVVELVRLHDEIAEMKDALEKKQREYSELNRIITEQYEIDKIKQMVVEVDGRRKSVNIRGQYWAKKKHEGVRGEDVYDVLLDVAPELAQKTYNTNSLSSWLREQFDQNPDYEIPDQLANLVDFKKVMQVVVTGK
jgi:hypothetical protein